MRPFTEKYICCSLDPDVLYGPFFYGLLPDDGRILMLRPFCVPVDLPVIYNWLAAYRHGSCRQSFAPVQQLLETYHDLLVADYSQSVMALIDGTPILQIDIIRADLDEISIGEEIEPGDHCIHFLLAPEVQESISYLAQALNSCLYSFFAFPGIHRIYCKTPVGDRKLNGLLQEAGFVLDKTVREYRGRINIYRYDHVPTLQG